MLQRLRTYSGRLRYLCDPVVSRVIPLLVGIESLLFLYWRETSLGIEGVPARLPLTLELWWFDPDFGMPMQTFFLIFHPVAGCIPVAALAFDCPRRFVGDDHLRLLRRAPRSLPSHGRGVFQGNAEDRA